MSHRTAVVNAEGVVENVIIADNSFSLPGYTLVPADNAPVGPGDLYMGGQLLRAEISASADKARVLANDADPVTVTAHLPLPEQVRLELWVDGVKRAEATTDAQGTAQFVLTFASPGLYQVEVRDTTPPLPGQPQPTKYRPAYLIVEAVAS